MNKPKQQAMFPQGEDLPLFSGTPQSAPASLFQPREEAEQPRLPGTPPAASWLELGDALARK